MGYMHYWQRAKTFPKGPFSRVVRDAALVLGLLHTQAGIVLCGPMGTGTPVVTEDAICFNGAQDCGHEARALGITWPAEHATGVGHSYEQGATGPGRPSPLLAALRNLPADEIQTTGSDGRDASRDSDVAGAWFAGAQLRTRTCGGDCSHESFDLPRTLDLQSWQQPERGQYFQCCKTAFKPYDLAVQCVLLVAKHHLGERITVASDGTAAHWREARAVCEQVLGYGSALAIDA